METVYFNGELMPKSEVRISPDDRGFLFADGVYEVTPAYQGRLLGLEAHLDRFARGLGALRIEGDTTAALAGVCERLLEANGLDDEDGAYVYLQATRGVAPRGHAFPVPSVTPTVYGFARRIAWWSAERWERGARAVVVPDVRWARADIKSIALLPNVLAQQAAVDAGVDDAILVRDGIAREGSHANLFAVLQGALVTHPCNHEILAGITRAFVLDIARDLGIPAVERPISLQDLDAAEEVFLTGTTTEVRPIVEIDGRPVGSGRPGPLTHALYLGYRQLAQSALPPTLVGG
jgi:D-alanine transaminase